MGSKAKNAQKRIKLGNFHLPSPQEIDDSRTPAGAWTAAQLAEWGIKWPPKHGWRRDLERRWKTRNGIADRLPTPEQISDWKYEVANDYTKLGLEDWVDNQIKAIKSA